MKEITFEEIETKQNEYWEFLAQWFFENEKELEDSMKEIDDEYTILAGKVKDKEKAIKQIASELQQDVEMWDAIRDAFCNALESYINEESS